LLGAVAMALSLVTLVIIAGGDRTEPLPVGVQPPDGARAVVSTGALVLRFARPVDREAVAAHLEIAPYTAGSLDVDRSVVRFTPTGGFRPGTRYDVSLRAGFRDVTGRALRQDLHLAFATRQARLVYSRFEKGGAPGMAPRNLWVTDLDGTPPRPLTRDALGILFAAAAPDGQHVAYSAPDPSVPGSSLLWLVGLEGTGRRQIGGDADGAILAVSWSPRGDLIAYERRSIVGARGELGRPRIFGVRPDGGGGGLLYGRGDEAGVSPVWSPDGLRLLAVDATRGGRVIVEPAGQPARIPSGGTDSGTWSPDGQQVAYADLVEQRDATRSVIRVVGRDGTPVADLARPGFSDTAPSWSPEGSAIAVVGLADDGATGIWLLDPTGLKTPVPVLLPNGARSGQFSPPVWSPGGAQVAFSLLVDAGANAPPESTVWEVWAANGDGTDVRRLPTDGLAETWVP
jgi:Tol biopolymer transport system component